MFSTDFTQLPAWIWLVGVIVVIAGAVWAAWMRSVKGLTTGMVVVVVGVVLILLGGAISPAAANAGGTPTPSPSACATCSGIVSVQTKGLVAGAAQTNASSYNSATHTITEYIGYDTSTNAFVAVHSNGTGAFAVAGTYLVIPLSIARSDVNNQTAGFNVAVTGVPTFTPSGSSTTYSILGYSAASGSSGGTWAFTFGAGSLKGSSPSQAAPSVTTGLGPDLVGVPVFGSATAYIYMPLAGQNSTVAPTSAQINGAGGITPFSTYTFDVSVSGGAGATPSTIAVNLVYLYENA